MVDEARILVAKAVVVLSPDVARQEIVERADGPPTGNMTANLQPFGVLVEHRIDNVNERLVTREEAVPASQVIAFEPTLALMLAEHLHDSPVRCQMIVPWVSFSHPGTVSDFQHV